jgi:hypothetical protein
LHSASVRNGRAVKETSASNFPIAKFGEIVLRRLVADRVDAEMVAVMMAVASQLILRSEAANSFVPASVFAEYLAAASNKDVHGSDVTAKKPVNNQIKRP